MTPLELARRLHAGTDGQFMADALLNGEQIIRALCVQVAVNEGIGEINAAIRQRADELYKQIVGK